MKTLVCLIAVLAMTAPVLAATVTIVGDASVPKELTLKYYVNGDLRGVALTLSCSDDATTNAAGTTAGENWNVCLDYAYDVVTAEGTYELGEGTPLAKVDGPGVPVGDVSDFSICVGYVDEGGTQGGVPQGSQGAPEDLCTIVISDSCTVTVAADTLRGGAVGSPVDIVFDLDGNGTPGDNTIEVTGDEECFTGTPEQVAAWKAWGEPQNWCGACWLQGDVNGDCLVTFSGDVMMAYGDFQNPTSPDALTGRSDWNMDGLLTFSGDVMALFTAFQGSPVCPVPCP
jgi:hypothetical protein